MNDIPHTHGARIEILERSFSDIAEKIETALGGAASTVKVELTDEVKASFDEIKSKIDGVVSQIEALHTDHSALEARVYALEGIVGPADDSDAPNTEEAQPQA